MERLVLISIRLTRAKSFWSFPQGLVLRTAHPLCEWDGEREEVGILCRVHLWAVGHVLVEGNECFLPHQKVPNSKCFPPSWLHAPFYVCRCQNNFPFSLLCGMWSGSLTAKPFHQYQSDLAHLYFLISCTDFCLNIPGEVETIESISTHDSARQNGHPAKVCFSFQQCLTLPLG